MAKNDDRDTQFNPKHRIVGAVIIVALAVILVPMILQKGPDDKDDKTLQLSKIPDKDTKVFIAKVDKPKLAGSQIKPNADKPVSMAAKKDSGKPQTDTQKKASALGTSNTVKTVKKTNDKSNNTVAKKASSTNLDAKKKWLIQVGTFADKINADRVSARLKQAGYKVDMANIELENKTAVRIRVGPFNKKESAKKNLARVNRVVGVKGIVIAQP